MNQNIEIGCHSMDDFLTWVLFNIGKIEPRMIQTNLKWFSVSPLPIAQNPTDLKPKFKSTIIPTFDFWLN